MGWWCQWSQKIKCARDSCPVFSTFEAVGRELNFGCWNTGPGRDTYKYIQIGFEFRQTNIHKQDCVCVCALVCVCVYHDTDAGYTGTIRYDYVMRGVCQKLQSPRALQTRLLLCASR